MAKDIAQRDLDQASFRISNLGTPTTIGDATRTDNTNVPLPNSGLGSPGSSFLAAAADHVHPDHAAAAAYAFTVSDQTEQAQTGPTETVVAQFPVDFSAPTPSVIPTFAALVEVDSGTATFNLRLSTTPDTAEGDVLATITKAAGGGVELRSVAGTAFAPAPTPTLLKITAASDGEAVTCRIRSKTITLRAV